MVLLFRIKKNEFRCLIIKLIYFNLLCMFFEIKNYGVYFL